MWAQMRGEGSHPMRTAVHITWQGAQMNFRGLTPYLTYKILTYVLVLLVLALRVRVPEAECEGVHVRRLLLVHGPRVNRLQQRRGKISGHSPIKILQKNCAYLLEGKRFVNYKDKQRFRTRDNKSVSGSKSCSILLWNIFLSGSADPTF